LPVEPASFFRRIQAEAEKTIKSLVEDLSDLSPAESFQITWNLTSAIRINEKLIEIISAATHSVYASVWPEQIDALNPVLVDAMARGVHVVVATFGACQPAANEFCNLESCAVNIQARTKAKLCTVVTDDKEVVIGELTDDNETSKGIWTQTRSVVLVAKEYIRHDIMVGILTEKIGVETYRKMIEQHPLWHS
jgi:sugar-specific transcriptional regulator TrmB